MKISAFALILVLSAVKAFPQSVDSSSPVNGAGVFVGQSNTYSVIKRDANSQVWESETYAQGPDGVAVTNVHQYTEMASGLNHLVNGEWVASKETVDILPDGSGAATNGQHQAYFPGDIYDGVIELVTPDGKHLKSRPLGISYFDGSNSVLIAELKHSIGQILPPGNQVIYTNAFTDFAADLVLTYRKGGFESDLVFREQPPVPEQFGLSSTSSQIELFTEFFDTPEPVQVPTQVATNSGQNSVSSTNTVAPQPSDATLVFGSMTMVRGKAFSVGASGLNPISSGNDTNRFGTTALGNHQPVSKTWAQIDGRIFLIESLSVRRIANELKTLPAPNVGGAGTATAFRHPSTHRTLPPFRIVTANSNVIHLAKANVFQKPAFVLDYVILVDQTNFTFRSDTTYAVSNAVSFNGTLTFEGGTVIKMSSGSSLTMSSAGTVVCNTGPYRPAIFTSCDDNSVGEQIAGSTGSPTVSDAECINLNTGSYNLHDFKMSYCGYAVSTSGGDQNFSNIQVTHALEGFSIVQPSSCSIRNVLISDITAYYAFGLSEATLDVEQLTVDRCPLLSANYDDPAWLSTINLTNCILTAVTNLGGFDYQTNCVAIANTGAGIYETAGAGNYYLPANSPYRNAGSANINSGLLSQLRQKTTCAPNIYSNSVVSSNAVLAAQVQRDIDIPDLGYHYDPIDYLADNWWFTNASVTIDPGTTVAGYNDGGIIITGGSTITSIGTPTAPVWFTRYSSVQEQPLNLPNTNASPGNADVVNSFHTTNAPSGVFQFTKFACPAGGGYHLYHNSSSWAYSNLLIEDCEFWSGKNDFSGYNNTKATLKNNLFARSAIGGQAFSITNVTLIESNNLFWNGSVAIIPISNSNSWCFFNNVFDHTTVSLFVSQNTLNGYNAYIGDTNVTKPLNPVASSDVFLTNFTYQTGPLGGFYQPTNSSLANTGSCTADLTALYHFTTTTNQVKETNSIVDLGYHYVALNTSGNPVDTDGDGLPDYLADPNGNGLADPGESDWAAATNAFPYGAAGYLYQVVGQGNISNFYTQAFDDSSFTNGQTAFGSPITNCWWITNDIRTSWPTGTDILLRRHFTLPIGVTNLSLGMAIDDTAQIFINGIEVTPTNVDHVQGTFFSGWFTNFGCATFDSIVLNGISPSVWRTGDNLLAVRGRDTGGAATFADFRIGYLPARGSHVLASILSPTNGQFFAFSPTNLVLTGWASSSDAPISTVGFYNGNTWLGNGTSTGSGKYELLWTNVLAGTNTLTMRVTNSLNEWGGSQPVTVTINTMPTVRILTPTNLQTLNEITNVQLTAIASDAEDGTNVTVTFYTNNVSAGTASHTIGATNTLTCNGMSANGHLTNAYQVVAVATDSHGARSASQIVIFKVAQTNPPPAVFIAYPTNTAVFLPGSDITIVATNNPANVTNVEFFVDGNSIGKDAGPIFELTKCCWTPGTYTLAAIGEDSSGRFVVSSNIGITIAPETPASSGFWDSEFGMSAASLIFTNPFPTETASGNDGTLYFLTEWNLNFTTNGTNWGQLNTPEVEVNQTFGWGGMFVEGTNIYAFGRPIVGSYPSNDDVFLWKNDQWQPVGNGFHVDTVPDLSFVSKMVQVGGEFYACGSFTSTGSGTDEDATVNRIAKYDTVSNRWVSVGNGITNGAIYAMASLGNQLYIGGSFTNAGGNSNANYIACLVGNTWTNVGSGVSVSDTNFGDVNSPVWTLSACDNKLFVGGEFDIAGSETNAHGVAVWDGTRWKSMDGGPGAPPGGYLDNASYHVFTISAHGNRVFIGGEFTNIFNENTPVTAFGIAMATWNEDQQRWIWSDLDRGINRDFGRVQHSTIINGNEPGKYDLYVAGNFSTVGSAEAISGDFYGKGGFARWRVGYPQSPGAPTVTNVSPVSPAIYTNGASTNILLVAKAHSSYTNFQTWNLHFYTNGVEVGVPTNNTAGTTDVQFTNAWDIPSPGLYVIDAVAMDDGGLVGRTAAPFIVNVKSPSNSIWAVDDKFTIPEGTISVTLPVLTNDAPSTGVRITNITTLHNDLGTPSISHDGASVIYRPAPNAFGSNVFFYTISDGGTNSDSASVTIQILSPPTVAISNGLDSKRFVTSAPPITILGQAKDYDGTVSNVILSVNGSTYQTLTTDSHGTFATNWTASTAGFYTFVAIATDNDGLRGTSAPVTIVLTNLTVSAHTPVAVISNFVANAVTNQGVATNNLPVITTGTTNLMGRAWDQDGDPVSYAVQLFRPEDWDFNISDNISYLVQFTQPFADITPGSKNPQGFHDGGDTNGAIGTLDFTQVPDGVYDLVLRVRGGTDEANAIVRVRLQSALKIGQFSFSEQDLVLPVNGIPLTVTRTYNSMNPDSGDFGASWSFALNDMNIKLDDERQDVTIGSANAPWDDDEDTSDNHLPKVVSVRNGGGWDVTLTLPDGKRTTFMFGYDGGWPELRAKWTPPQGITAKLEPINSADAFIQFGISGLSTPYWVTSQTGLGLPLFENQDFPGWILTTADGTKYKISRGWTNNVAYDVDGSGSNITARVYGPPKLAEIDDLSTNKIVIQTNGIFNYDLNDHLKRWTLFERDDAGRIKALHDPNGGSNGIPVVKYVYNNDTGNLIQVLKLVDRTAGTYTTNKYHYDNPKFPHYITSIENGDGIPVARNFYDDSGRLTQVQDANGTLTIFNHSLTSSNEIVVDRLGHTNSYVYDANGNVIWATNALGQVTATAYKDPNNVNLETAVTNAYGTAQATWTLYAYDANGNQTNVISMGHTNSFQYDGIGNLLMQVDPLGNVARNFYDSSGNLTNTTQYDANNNAVTSSSSVYINGKLMATINANGQTNATFAYDEFGNLTNSTGANGFSRGFGYDANGNQTSSTYFWTPPGGGSAVPVTTTTVYDGQNRVIQTIDALGNTHQTFYNTLGKVDHTIDKFGNSNSFLYDALGNLIQTTYPNNTFTRTVYDAAGRAYFTTDRNGVTGTRTDYDAAGRATNSVRFTNVVVGIVYSGSVASSVLVSAIGPVSTNSTVYDAVGRVTSRTSPDGTTSYDYYSDGQLMHVIDALNHTNFYAYDADGRQTNVVDALNHSTRFKYDAVGRAIATVYNDNTGTTNIFDALGQRTNVLDQAGLATQFGYDVSGQLTNVIKPAVPDPENSGTPTPPSWQYLYDSYGRPSVTIDPKGHGTTNFFDQFGRQLSQRLAMNQTNLMQYNALGQVATNFDFKGQRTEFYYDRFGRVTNKFYFLPTLSHPSNSVTYAYNQFDQLTNITERYNSDADAIYALNPVGPQPRYFAKALIFAGRTSPKWGAPLAVVSLIWLLMSLPFGRRLQDILHWYYLDGGWRLNGAKWERGRIRLRLPSYFWRAVTLVTLCVLIVDDPSWDNLFNARASCDIPATLSTLTTRITNFVYDAEGRLTQMNAPEGVINYTYNPATGRLQSTCTGNSAWDYGYDALGRLQTVHVTLRAGNTVNETTAYTYDAVGNRNSVTYPTGVVTTNLYDSLNRLTVSGAPSAY